MILDNSLDRNFHMMLKPLIIMQLIYCQPIFRIGRAFVTPNGTRETIHMILGVVVIIVTNVGNIFLDNFLPENSARETKFKYGLTDAVFYSVSSILMCVSKILQSDKNVQLVMKMQKAYRIFQDTNGLERFKRKNWIFVVTIFLSYLVYNLTFTVSNVFNTTHFVYTMILLYFDVQVIVAVRIVKFLEYELVLWKKELNRFLETCSKTNHEQLIKYLVDAGDEQIRLFSAYRNIIEAFMLFPGVFGMPILLMMVEGFGHPLLYIQFVIDISSTELSQSACGLSLLVSFFWILKTFTLLSFLCVGCQQFYLAVADVDAACAVILADDRCLVCVQRLAKNVLRHNECVGAGCAMRASSLVSISASTPLQLLTLLGTYTVVLLQFAFL